MEEDDSLLDANADNVIIRETQPRDSPRSFSKSLISRLSLCQITEAETASLQTNNTSTAKPGHTVCAYTPQIYWSGFHANLVNAIKKS